MKKELFYALMVLLCVQSVSALISLDFNETRVFSYVDNLNVSRNETFYCRAVNVSEVCTVDEVVVSLSPGESRLIQNGSLSLDVSCSSEDVVADTCVIDRSLDPGETYKNSGGACDVVIDVPECDSDSGDSVVDGVTQLIPYTISRTTEGFRISLDNVSYEISGHGETYTAVGEIPMVCPGALEVDKVDEDEISALCNEFAPLYYGEWIRPTLEACKNSATSHTSDVKECDAQKSALRDEIGDLKAEVSSLNSRVDAEVASKAELRDARDDAMSKTGIWRVFAILGGIYGFVATVIGVVLAFLLFKKTRGGEF